MPETKYLYPIKAFDNSSVSRMKYNWAEDKDGYKKQKNM